MKRAMPERMEKWEEKARGTSEENALNQRAFIISFLLLGNALSMANADTVRDRCHRATKATDL